MKKYICIFLTTVLISLSIVPVLAQGDIILRNGWNADEALVDVSANKGPVNKIYVTGLTINNNEIRLNTEYWTKGLYYFFTTKTRFGDLPFHYLVGWDGKVYEGMRTSNQEVAPIKDENAILVGYLSNYDSFEVTRLGEEALQETLLTAANKYGVSSSRIISTDWKIVPTDDLQESLVEVFESADSKILEGTIADLRPYVTQNYSPPEKNYSSEVLAVTVPEEMEVNSAYDLSVRVKNTGDSWFKDSSDEITIAKKDGTASRFALTNEWISSSQVKGLQDEQVENDAETNLAFRVNCPLTTDSEISEEFILKTLDGTVLEGTEFTISAKINTAGLEIVEVKPTPTNYLNVRTSPGLSGELITQAAPGERYVVIERQSGWVKIRLNEEEEGWASSQYLRTL